MIAPKEEQENKKWYIGFQRKVNGITVVSGKQFDTKVTILVNVQSSVI